jgi:hypothetical protein
MLSGVVGSIKWGPYPAAAINGYTVTPTNKARTEWDLRAVVVLADAFKMTQRPLVFVAKHKRGEWQFPIVSLTPRERGQYQGPISARLGPPHTIRTR